MSLSKTLNVGYTKRGGWLLTATAKTVRFGNGSLNLFTSTHCISLSI